MQPTDVSFANSLISKLNLDLSNLDIYTEAASGPYCFNPIFAALAGAKKVYAQTRDSRYATKEDVARETFQYAKYFNVEDKIEIMFSRCHARLKTADIVTNSNFVRPIDEPLITSLKETAVIPLMWETWEFRPTDFALDVCKANNILTLGTIEHKSPIDMLPYNGLLALKMIFELDYDCGDVLLIGGPAIFAGPMKDYMTRIGVPVTWIADLDEADMHYADLQGHLNSNGQKYSILLLAEQSRHHEILGPDAYISFADICRINPQLKLGVISGGVNKNELHSCGIKYFPETIMPGGHMSYQPYQLGYKPVLTLFAGGLKVGEAMARARLAGLSVSQAADFALRNSPAMDYLGEYSWT